jgi:gamma-glutamyltranspeptidase/glutathione hydrolase
MIYYVLDEDSPNSLEPRKRTMQTITPSIALKDGSPFLAFGTPGADLQEQSKLQVFLNIVEFGMNPQEAIEAHRFNTLHPTPMMPIAALMAPPRSISMESRIPTAERDKLTRMGYAVRSQYDWVYAGIMGAIKIDPRTGWKEAGADPRGEATAIAW